jgi:hypothetical protein
MKSLRLAEDEARAIACTDPSVTAGTHKIEVASARVAFLPHASSASKAQ